MKLFEHVTARSYVSARHGWTDERTHTSTSWLTRRRSMSSRHDSPLHATMIFPSRVGRRRTDPAWLQSVH